MIEYTIKDACISCCCIALEDDRSLHPLSEFKFCTNCKSNRCSPGCILKTFTDKYCKSCKKEYDVEEIYCYRCYMCPHCLEKLEVIPLLYKKSDTGKFELIKRENDRNKIAGKSVYFKCKNCSRFKFNTKIESRPQSLQEIVVNNIKDETDLRFDELNEYYSWRLNYFRILDKSQNLKFKDEILQRFSTLEISKILKDYKFNELYEKELAILSDSRESTKEYFPVPNHLSFNSRSKCPDCFTDISENHLYKKFPLIYTCPMIGYEMHNDEFVPILISFVNCTGTPLKVNIIVDEEDNVIFPITGLKLDHGDRDKIENVPTCLLQYMKTGDWKKELLKRAKNIEALKYRIIEDNQLDEVLENGPNWQTYIIKVKRNTVKFRLNIAMQSETEFNHLTYTCHSFIISTSN